MRVMLQNNHSKVIREKRIFILVWKVEAQSACAFVQLFLAQSLLGAYHIHVINAPLDAVLPYQCTLAVVLG